MTSPLVTREEAIDMLGLAILMIKRGSTDAAISQLYFLIDNLEVATALDQMLIAREIGCTPEFLCQ